MTLFSGLDTDVHFSVDETGVQWEDSLFELQNAKEWRMVMSRGQDERSQMHAMSLLLNTCSDMTNRVLIDDGARWIFQGDEQERVRGLKNDTKQYSSLFVSAVVLTLGGDDIVEVDVPDREQVDCEREIVEVRDKEKGDKTRTNNARSNM